MALSCGVSFFQPLELHPHECDEACTEEAEEVRIFLPCLACYGDGCKACGPGHGFTALYTCPRARDLGDAWEYLQLFHLYPGTLPLACGLYDHPAPYVAAMRILEKAKPLMIQALNKLAEKEAK
jgi:hypothetical protein